MFPPLPRFLLLLAAAAVALVGAACTGEDEGTPEPGPGSPSATATATSVPTSTPVDPARASELAALVLAPIIEEFGPTAAGLDVHAVPLGLRDDAGEFWAGMTNGAQPGYLDDDGVAVNYFHGVSIYRYGGDGVWSPRIDWLEIPSAPQRTEVTAGVVASLSGTWLAIRGPTGAHAGTLDIIRFDGAQLESMLSHISSRPNAGEIVDLDGDGVPEVVLNDSNPFVFGYTSGVEERSETVQRWDGTAFVPVEIAVPPGLDGGLASDAAQVVELAQADLWRDAAALAVETSRRAPDDDALRWLSVAVNRTAATRHAHAGTAGQPLLTEAFAGEYDAALVLMRALDPAEAFALDGPLIVGTAAALDPTTMAVSLIDYSERALMVRPDDAAIHAVHAVALTLASPDDLGRARAAIERASELAAGDAFLEGSARFLGSVDVAPGAAPLPPGRESLLPGPDAAFFDGGRTLGSGDRGELVRALQQRLAAIPSLGFEDPGRYYDVYNEATRQAVLRFQLDAGIEPLGVVDRETWEAIVDVFEGDPAPPTSEDTTHPAVPPPAHGPAGESVVYLTFDDGPHPTWTPRVLEVLARYEVKATFFILGVNASNFPGVVATVVDAGHQPENHTYDHASLDQLDHDAFIEEVSAADQAIVNAAGERVLPIGCLRPPYGATDARTAAFASELGKTITLWNLDTQDWRKPGAEQIATHVLENVHPGSVVLMHDGGGDRDETVAALDTVLRELTGRGYRFELVCR